MSHLWRVARDGGLPCLLYPIAPPTCKPALGAGFWWLSALSAKPRACVSERVGIWPIVTVEDLLSVEDVATEI